MPCDSVVKMIQIVLTASTEGFTWRTAGALAALSDWLITLLGYFFPGQRSHKSVASRVVIRSPWWRESRMQWWIPKSKSSSLSCHLSWEKRKLRVGLRMKTSAITATKWRLGDFSRARAHTLPQGEGHDHKRSVWREKEGVLITFPLAITILTILLVQERNRSFTECDY